jgi:hypothetical protein
LRTEYHHYLVVKIRMFIKDLYVLRHMLRKNLVQRIASWSQTLTVAASVFLRGQTCVTTPPTKPQLKPLPNGPVLDPTTKRLAQWLKDTLQHLLT